MSQLCLKREKSVLRQTTDLLVQAGDIDPVTVKIANWLLIRQPEL